jgi:hypothetical protein
MSEVIVFRLLVPTPVWHLQATWRPEEHPTILADGWKRNEVRTWCGQVTWRVEWRDVREPGQPARTEHRGQIGPRGTYLRRDHAELIGRQCQRCQRCHAEETAHG